jgi:tetratricopeptide (TPR) repeat protein
VRTAVAEARTALADIKALTIAGRYQQAFRDIPAVTAVSRRTGYNPVIAEALLRLGELETLLGEVTKAERHYEEAIWLAERSRDDEVTVEAADQLVSIVGYSQGRYREAERWAELANAVLQRLGPGHDILNAWRANNLAMVYHREGRLEDALAMFKEAVATKTRALGENHFDVALSMDNLAIELFEMGRLDEAIARNRRALEIYRKTLGPDHPSMAVSLGNGAEFMSARGRYAEAQTMADSALASLERSLGPDHPDLAFPLTTIGLSWIGRGRPSLAISFLERALAIRESKKAQPELLAQTRFALARALWGNNQELNRAIALAEQAGSDYRRTPDTKRQAVEVDGWLEGHQARPQRLSMR